MPNRITALPCFPGFLGHTDAESTSTPIEVNAAVSWSPPRYAPSAESRTNGPGLPACRSSACQIDTGGDQDDGDPIGLVWPLPEEGDGEQCRQRRHQSAKGGTTRSAKDGNRAAVQDERDNGHENALENRLRCNLSER